MQKTINNPLAGIQNAVIDTYYGKIIITNGEIQNYITGSNQTINVDDYVKQFKDLKNSEKVIITA